MFESLEKLKLPPRVRYSFPDILMLGYLGALPSFAYCLHQGIPAYRLASPVLWLGPTLVGSFYVLAAGPWTAWGLWTVWQSLKNIRSSNWREMVIRSVVAVGLLAFFAAAAALQVFAGYHLVKPFPATTVVAYASLIVVATGIFAACVFESYPDVPEAQLRTRTFGRVVLEAVLCIVITLTAWRDLAPIGGVHLSAQNMGGGTPVMLRDTEGQADVAALILDAGAGWFVRLRDRCDALVFVRSEAVYHQVWLNTPRDNVCPLDSKYIDALEGIRDDPTIDNPDDPGNSN